MYIGRVGAGLAWLIGAIALSFLLTPYIAWPIGIIGSFWQYDTVYGQLFATDEEQARERDAGKFTRILIGVILLLLMTTFFLSRTMT